MLTVYPRTTALSPNQGLAGCGLPVSGAMPAPQTTPAGALGAPPPCLPGMASARTRLSRDWQARSAPDLELSVRNRPRHRVRSSEAGIPPPDRSLRDPWAAVMSLAASAGQSDARADQAAIVRSTSILAFTRRSTRSDRTSVWVVEPAPFWGRVCVRCRSRGRTCPRSARLFA